MGTAIILAVLLNAFKVTDATAGNRQSEAKEQAPSTVVVIISADKRARGTSGCSACSRRFTTLRRWLLATASNAERCAPAATCAGAWSLRRS